MRDAASPAIMAKPRRIGPGGEDSSVRRVASALSQLPVGVTDRVDPDDVVTRTALGVLPDATTARRVTDDDDGASPLSLGVIRRGDVRGKGER